MIDFVNDVLSCNTPLNPTVIELSYIKGIVDESGIELASGEPVAAKMAITVNGVNGNTAPFCRRGSK